MGIVKKNGVKTDEIPMKFTGEKSQFAGTLRVDSKGVYEVTVYAFDPSNGNTGLDKVTFIVK